MNKEPLIIKKGKIKNRTISLIKFIFPKYSFASEKKKILRMFSDYRHKISFGQYKSIMLQKYKPNT